MTPVLEYADIEGLGDEDFSGYHRTRIEILVKILSVSVWWMMGGAEGHFFRRDVVDD